MWKWGNNLYQVYNLQKEMLYVLWVTCSSSQHKKKSINYYLSTILRYSWHNLWPTKDVQCWILRLGLQNFLIISESLAANLEKVRQTSVWQFQSSDLFVFFIVPQRLTLVSNAKRKISKSNKSELWNRLPYRCLFYFLEVGSQAFRNDYKNSRS